MNDTPELTTLASPATSVVDRVLHMLACVANTRRPLSAKQIAAEVGAPLSTVYRLLSSLKKWGLLQEHADSGLYEPGPTGVQLAWGFDQNSLLISQSRDEIAELVQRTDESVGLLVPLGDKMICLATLESEQPLRCSFARGRTHPLSKGPSAMALLAFLPEARAKTLLEAQHRGDAESVSSTIAQLSIIREKRYALGQDDTGSGVWGISAPIVSANGRLEGTLTLMAPASRVLGGELELAKMTRAAADRISLRL